MLHNISKEKVLANIGDVYQSKLINSEYEVREVDVSELITEKRIDIIIKLLTLDFLFEDNEWLEEKYSEHIRCITEGTFIENGSDIKNNLTTFKSEFKSICTSIKNNGFDSNISIIPVTKNMEPINGAHRVAACLKYNKKITVCVIPEVSINYDLSFFEKRGCSEDILNLALIKLMELSNKFVCGIVWPAANIKNSDVKEYLPEVIKTKAIKVNKSGMHNLVCEAYSHESWLGTSENKYEGAWKKALPCYGDGENNEVNFFIIKLNIKSNLIEYKDNVRSEFNLGKHSIHICDDNIDSTRLLKYFMNNDITKILNSSSPYLYSDFIKKLELLRRELYKNNLTENDIVLDGSALLGILGLRKPNDIDYLARVDYKLKNADFHNSELKYHDSSLSELLTNPNKSLWVFGFKFLSINQLIKMKSNRNESKDLVDINLLKAFSTGNVLLNFKSNILGFIHFTKIKIRKFLVTIIVFLKLKTFLKKALQKLGKR